MKPGYVINTILKNISYFLKTEKAYGKPVIRYIENTNACMMRCKMCPRKNMKRKVGFMDMGLFKKIIDQARWNDHVYLHLFGDPLMHPKLVEMVQYCTDKGIKAQIASNPNLISEKLVNELIDAGLDSWGISFDAMDDKTYKEIRGQNANYEDGVKKIELLLKIKNKRKSNMRFEISMVNMKDTKEFAEKYRKFWTREGVDFVDIKEFDTFDGSDDTIVELGDKDTFSKVFKRDKETCTEPWMAMSVTWDGKIVACSNDYDDKFVLGDFNKDSLDDIWNGPKYRAFRKMMRSGNLDKNPLCKDCQFKMNTTIITQIRTILKRKKY